LHPENTIFNSKRFIGRSLEEDNVRQYAASHPFTVVPSNTSHFSRVAFSIKATGHKPVVTPEEVGTQVLKYLVQIASDFLGHNQVNKAVIAVPAKFTQQQREATGSAYKAAGLKVIRVLEEPTAAAVAYDLHKKDNIHHIIVYDFGGGTLDVSLLYVANGSVQVYATDGDETLGGSDLDMCLYDLIRHNLEAQSGHSVQLHSLSEMDKSVTNSDLCLSANVRAMAEQVKKELSSAMTTEFSCRVPSEDKHNTGAAFGETAEYIRIPISRSDFEVGCKPLFDRSMIPVIRLLGELEMSVTDVDEVVLVGGTTRVPFVKQQLREFFGKDLNDHIDPDVTVAVGAASILD